jgi:outer membrane biosynthesis protein TonB
MPIQDSLVLRARGSELLIMSHHVVELKGIKAPKEFGQYFLDKALINRPARKLFQAWLRKDNELWRKVFKAVQDITLEGNKTEDAPKAKKAEKAVAAAEAPVKAKAEKAKKPEPKEEKKEVKKEAKKADAKKPEKNSDKKKDDKKDKKKDSAKKEVKKDDKKDKKEDKKKKKK